MRINAFFIFSLYILIFRWAKGLGELGEPDPTFFLS